MSAASCSQASSADWQLIVRDGTALGDIRYTLEPDHGDLVYVQSRAVRHGGAERHVLLTIVVCVDALLFILLLVRSLTPSYFQQAPPPVTTSA